MNKRQAQIELDMKKQMEQKNNEINEIVAKRTEEVKKEEVNFKRFNMRFNFNFNLIVFLPKGKSNGQNQKATR